MRDFFAEALKELEFHNLEHFQAVASCYEELTEFPGENRDKNSILFTMTNETTEQLLKSAEPFFVDSFINRIRAKTQFLDERVETDLRIGFILIGPYVEFTKSVGVKKILSVKFWFRIETDTSMEELSIKTDLHNPELRLIKIEKMHVELKSYSKKWKEPTFLSTRI